LYLSGSEGSRSFGTRFSNRKLQRQMLIRFVFIQDWITTSAGEPILFTRAKIANSGRM
jgi:hypothetical protein